MGPVTHASQDRDAVFPQGRPPELTPLMLASPPQTSLLDELDARQNEVLRQIDELSAQVETVLNQWLTTREAAEAA